MIVSAILLSVTLTAPTALADEDVLEPSVQNEVDHALARAPTNAVPSALSLEYRRVFCITNDFFGTNGLSHTDCAIKLISAQKADGRWLCGTNDVSSIAVEILQGL